MTPIDKIRAKLGPVEQPDKPQCSFAYLARRLGVDRFTVYTWNRELGVRGGCGGNIPHRYWEALETLFEREGLVLEATDLVTLRRDLRAGQSAVATNQENPRYATTEEG